MATIARPGTTACKIYVGPLTQNTKDMDLWKHFQSVGPIREAVVLKDKQDPTKSRGFGFVVFQEEKHVQEAIEAKNRTNLCGNSITVAVAGSGAPKPEQKERNSDRDWTCGTCSINNFCFRMLCYRCGGPRPADAKNWGTRSTVKAGDWICRGCHKVNLPFHRECRHCAKPLEVPVEEKAPVAENVPDVQLFSPKDTALMTSHASNFVASIGASSCGIVGQANMGAGSYGNMGGVHNAVHDFSGGMPGGGRGRGVVDADGVVVGSGRGKGYDADGIKIKLKHSDWQCPVCWAPNNKYREQCNINGCEGKKPPRKGQTSVAEVGQNLRRMKYEDGDWECAICANHNFKNRDTCNGNRCTEKRPFTTAPVATKQQQRVTIAPKEWSWY